MSESTYNLSTPIGQARLLIPDRDPTTPIFTDAEIGAFLALEQDTPRRAAALALETAASSAALLERVTQLSEQGTTTTFADPARAAAELRARAAALRAQADADDEAAGAAFDIAELGLSPFGTRAILDNARQRGGY